MAVAMGQQFATGLRCPPRSSSMLAKPATLRSSYGRQAPAVTCAVGVSNAQTREWQRMKEMFEDAYERCRTAPTDGVSFTLEDFHGALDKYDFDSDIGTKVLPFSSFSTFFSSDSDIGWETLYEILYAFLFRRDYKVSCKNIFKKEKKRILCMY